MKELLGEHNEYGLVTENSEEGLYEGVKRLLEDPGLLRHYREQAAIRGKAFESQKTVSETETFLANL